MKTTFGAVLAWVGLAVATTIAVITWIVPEVHLERRLLDDAHQSYIRANKDDVQLRDGPRVNVARRRIVAAIRSMQPMGGRGSGTTEVLRTIDELDSHYNMTLQRLEPADDVERPPGEHALSIEWSGSYRSIVRALAQLSRGPALLRVIDVRLDHNAKMSDSVDAVVHVDEYASIDAP